MSFSGSRTTRMRDLAGLMLLYLGAAWNAEQMTSQARQPLHLSALIVRPLMVFLTLAIADNPSLLEVFGNVVQAQLVQRRLRGNALAVPALLLVVPVQELG